MHGTRNKNERRTRRRWQARPRIELIDLRDSNPYPSTEAELPDRARHATNVRLENEDRYHPCVEYLILGVLGTFPVHYVSDREI